MAVLINGRLKGRVKINTQIPHLTSGSCNNKKHGYEKGNGRKRIEGVKQQ